MVFVSASADESCNLPMCEANACGVPGVVFDVREELGDHCYYIRYGIVVNDVNDVQGFGDAMEQMKTYHYYNKELMAPFLLPLDERWKFFDFPFSYGHALSEGMVCEGTTIKDFYYQMVNAMIKTGRMKVVGNTLWKIPTIPKIKKRTKNKKFT